MSNENIENATPNATEEVVTSEEKTTEATQEGSESLSKAEAKIVELKKQLKEAKKPKETTTEEKPKKSESNEEFGLLEKTYLRSADIVEADEVELAQKLQKETGKDLDALIESSYFKSELKDLRDAKATTKATSDVKGGGASKATDSVDHWVDKGVPPTREQVPDRATRVKIIKQLMQNASGSGKKFYND
jgi:hypothetical protein